MSVQIGRNVVVIRSARKRRLNKKLKFRQTVVNPKNPITTKASLGEHNHAASGSIHHVKPGYIARECSVFTKLIRRFCGSST